MKTRRKIYIPSKKMAYEDNIVGCAEAPIWIPSTFRMDSLDVYKTVSIYLKALQPGPGKYTRVEEGYKIDENPSSILTVNGIQYNLIETYLTVPGAHRLPGLADPSPMEIQLYFRHVKDFNKFFCIAIPVEIGDDSSNIYFEYLLKPKRVVKPTIASLFPLPPGTQPTAGVATVFKPNSEFLLYRGADFRGRNAGDSRPKGLCTPIWRPIDVMLCLKAVTISRAAYDVFARETVNITRKIEQERNNRDFPKKEMDELKERQGNYRGPARPVAEIIQTRLTRLGTLIRGGVTVEGIIARTGASRIFVKRLNTGKWQPILAYTPTRKLYYVNPKEACGLPITMETMDSNAQRYKQMTPELESEYMAEAYKREKRVPCSIVTPELLAEVTPKTDAAAAAAKSNYVSTKSLKCYTLDPTKDIQGDQVFIGDKSKTAKERSLDDEIKGADAERMEDEISQQKVRPGDIEQALALVIGIIVAVIVCAFIAYYLWKFVFSRYLSVQNLYKNPLSAKAITKTVQDAMPKISLSDICPGPQKIISKG